MTTRTLTITLLLLLLLMGCDDTEPDDGGDDMADSATPAPADLPGDGDGDGDVSPSEPCCNLDGVWGPCVSEPEQWCADPQPGWPEQCDDACALLP